MTEKLGQKQTNTNNYLGEFPTTVDKTPTELAMEFIEKYGQFDGAHHKSWVIDQVARILKGTEIVSVIDKWGPSEQYPNGFEEHRSSTVEDPSKEYMAWVENMLGRDERGIPQYSYDEGIAP